MNPDPGSRASVDLRFEVCIDSVEGALASREAGAHRVELCADLLEGGTTPSAGMIATARRHVDLELNVMIRPRGGDFCYTDTEFEAMKHDIAVARDLGADGVVLGLLHPDGTVDLERTGELIDRARPASVTFHRAFDMTRDPFEALEALVSLGADRILSSGQEATALEGADRLRDLVARAKDRIVVMPGGGIHERNVAEIVARTGAKEIHFACRVAVEGPMTHRNPNCFMGGELRPPEFARWTTPPNAVHAVLRAARRSTPSGC
jgi:copper homeostasis protein